MTDTTDTEPTEFERPWLTIVEAAKARGVSVKTIRRRLDNDARATSQLPDNDRGAGPSTPLCWGRLPSLRRSSWGRPLYGVPGVPRPLDVTARPWTSGTRQCHTGCVVSGCGEASRPSEAPRSQTVGCYTATQAG